MLKKKATVSYSLYDVVAVAIRSHLLQLVLGVEIPLLELGARKLPHVGLHVDSLALERLLDICVGLAFDNDPQAVLGVGQQIKHDRLLLPALVGVKLDFEACTGGGRAGKLGRQERGIADGHEPSPNVKAEREDLH